MEFSTEHSEWNITRCGPVAGPVSWMFGMSRGRDRRKTEGTQVLNY